MDDHPDRSKFLPPDEYSRRLRSLIAGAAQDAQAKASWPSPPYAAPSPVLPEPR